MKTPTNILGEMLKGSKYAFVIITLVLVNLSVLGQVTITIPANSFQYSLQDLSQTLITNVSGQTLPGCYAIIICTDGGGNRVFEMRTPNTNLPTGSSYLGYASLTNGQITGGNSQAYTTLQQTGSFPPGNYTICVTEYNNGGSRTLGTGCTSITTSNYGNLYLLSPQDEAIIETLYPTLDWTTYNTRKLDAQISYSLRVCLLQPGQNYGEAITGNPPLLYQQNLKSNSFTYPSSAPLLDTTQKYVWQVEAHITIGNNQPQIVYSEIWMFQFGKHSTEEHKKKNKTEPVQYAYLSKKLTGATYLYSKYINFRYNNETRDSLLSYSVYKAGETEPVFTSKQVPVFIKPRVNYISLAIPKSVQSDSKGDSSTAEYTLEVRNSRKESWLLKFSIIDKKKNKKGKRK